MGPRAGLDRGGKISPPTVIRSPDRPTRSQSLYRLSYRAHADVSNVTKNKNQNVWGVESLLKEWNGLVRPKLVQLYRLKLVFFSDVLVILY